jgi:hypothetical protein
MCPAISPAVELGIYIYHLENGPLTVQCVPYYLNVSSKVCG